jgi:hypothetical protein
LGRWTGDAVISVVRGRRIWTQCLLRILKLIAVRCSNGIFFLHLWEMRFSCKSQDGIAEYSGWDIQTGWAGESGTMQGPEWGGQGSEFMIWEQWRGCLKIVGSETRVGFTVKNLWKL